jgi:AcrR family transcriptional regulator
MDEDAVLGDAGSRPRQNVLRATRALLATDGLSVTMDDIASASGVSRRSLSRHFNGRDELIAEALDGALAWYVDRVHDELRVDASLEHWLVSTARLVHRSSADAGLGVWQLASSRDEDLPPALAAVNRRRRANRRKWTQDVAQRAWQLAGAEGPVPDVVLEAFALSLSVFATHSMVGDLRRSADRLAEHTGAMLVAVIDAQIALVSARSRAAALRPAAGSRSPERR